MVNRDRVGKLSWGSGPTEIEIMLALSEDVPIAKSWKLPALPPSYDPSEFTVNEPTNEAVRRWKINRFEGGEGAPIFDATSDEYFKGYGGIPNLNRFEGGIVVGPKTARTRDDLGATVAGVDAMAIANSKLIYIEDQTAYEWDPANDEWDSTGFSTGAASGAPVGFCSVADASYTYFAIYSTDELWRFTASLQNLLVASTAWPTSGFGPTLPPVSMEGRLFAVDSISGKLLEIDPETVNTVTVVGDVIADGPLGAPPIASDVGIVWATEDQDGIVSIWQYNIATNTTERLSLNDIPRFAAVYAMRFLKGFLWVGFSPVNQPSGSTTDDGYLYYQRGSQRGVLGPLRPVSAGQGGGVTPIDFWGDDLLIHHGDLLWAYNAAAGGLYNLGEGASGTQTNATPQAVLFCDSVFIPLSYIDRWELEKYEIGLAHGTDAGGCIETGRFDFGWPAIDKALIDITVTFDALPANTTVAAYYSVDGGTWTLAGTATTDGDTVETFTISTPANPVVGESFALRVCANTSDEDATPVIREVMARASIDELEFTYDLQLDLGYRQDNTVDEATMLANLETLAAVSGYVNFENPWQVAATADPTTEVVKVVGVGKPELGDDGIPYVTLRLKGRDVA